MAMKLLLPLLACCSLASAGWFGGDEAPPPPPPPPARGPVQWGIMGTAKIARKMAWAIEQAENSVSLHKQLLFALLVISGDLL